MELAVRYHGLPTPSLVPPAAIVLLAGCELFGGGAVDAGASLDAAGPSCGTVTFFGECEGDTLRYCDEGVLRTLDCAAYYPGYGRCLRIDDEYGHDCAVDEGAPCYWTRPDGTSFTSLCGGAPAPGCDLGPEATVCTTSLFVCEASDVGTCRGETAVVICAAGQPTVLPCDLWGASCAAGLCTGVGEGGVCASGLLVCAAGLYCVDGVCQGDPPPDAGAPIDAGTPIDAGPPPECPIRGSYVVFGRAELDAFAAGGCTEIPGNLTIDSTSLTDLRGLERLVRIGGELQLRRNSRLASLAALSNLTSVTTLEVFDNDALTDLRGLERLGTATNVTIFENGGLTSLAGLGGIRDTQLIVRNNAGLRSLRGLDSITALNAFDLEGNPALTDLSALRSLRTVRQRLFIASNAALTSLSGFDGLTSVGNAIIIRTHDSLRDITALRGVQTIGLGITISSNAVLASMDFGGITSFSGGVTILLNPMLSECDANALVAALMATGWRGTTNIASNLSCP